jgi:hypothetical protein
MKTPDEFVTTAASVQFFAPSGRLNTYCSNQPCGIIRRR